MKKILIASFWLSCLSFQAYSMSLDQALNQFSASLTDLSETFKGGTGIIPPPAKTELEQLENQLLIRIDQYIDDLKNNEPFAKTDDFINLSNEYITKNGKNLTIELWQDLLTTHNVLNDFKYKDLTQVFNDFKPRYKNTSDMLVDFNAKLNQLKEYGNIAAQDATTEKYYNDILAATQSWIEKLEQEATQEPVSTNEQQLLAQINEFIKVLPNENFANATNFSGLAKDYLEKENGQNKTIKLWYDLLLARDALKFYTGKQLSNFPGNTFEEKAQKLQEAINNLTKYYNNLKNEGSEASEPKTKNYYNKILTSLEGLISGFEQELKEKNTEQQTKEQLLAQALEIKKQIAANQALNNDFVQKFNLAARAFLVHKDESEILADDTLKTIKFYSSIAPVYERINTNQNKTAMQIIADNPNLELKSINDVIEMFNRTQRLFQNDAKFFVVDPQLATKTTNQLNDLINKFQQELSANTAAEETKAQITALETKLKDFSIANFSMPLTLGKKEDLSQWKTFEDDYKKLQNLTTQANASINPLIEFWYTRGYLKVNFENQNLLQTTFALKGNSNKASIEAVLASFDQLTKQYNKLRSNVIGAAGDGKLSNEKFDTFENALSSSIKTNLDQQKGLIDYIKANFSDPETGKMGDVSLEPVQSKLTNAVATVTGYKDLYEKYAKLETNPETLKPYAYWYYRSLLLTSYDTFKKIFNIGRISPEAGYKIYEFNQEYEKFKPASTLSLEELKGLYLLDSLYQASVGDMIIKILAKEGRSRE